MGPRLNLGVGWVLSFKQWSWSVSRVHTQHTYSTRIDTRKKKLERHHQLCCSYFSLFLEAGHERSHFFLSLYEQCTGSCCFCPWFWCCLVPGAVWWCWWIRALVLMCSAVVNLRAVQDTETEQRQSCCSIMQQTGDENQVKTWGPKAVARQRLILFFCFLCHDLITQPSAVFL